MPLPSDEKLLQLSQDLLQQFDTIFGLHPGFRPAHAKGLLLSGTFTPDPAAASLTRAPHLNRPSTPVTARFSNSTGIPLLPDNDPHADPRGLAIRFNLAEHVHTDIVSHSFDGFPTHTGQEFLEFLRALAASSQASSSPTPVEKFLSEHPSAFAFVQAPKPSPASFATEAYFAVTAMRFTNASGTSRFGRYRILPDAGIQHLDASVAAGKDPDYLFAELQNRIGSDPIGFRIEVQLAEDSDVVDNATVHWPDSRPLAPFGHFALDAIVPENEAQQKRIIFDPIPRVDGIDPSDDPLLELRAAVYLLSGRRRRAA